MSEYNRENIRQLRRERDESRWSGHEISCSSDDNEFGGEHKQNRRRGKRRGYRRPPKTFEQYDD